MEKMSILIKNLDFLASHNKNYTNKQYFTILECLDIVKELEEKADLCKEDQCDRAGHDCKKM